MTAKELPLSSDSLLATSHSPLLYGLPAGELQRVVEHLSPSACMSGDVILRQGERNSTLYILRSGVLQVTAQTSDGSERALGRLTAGECAGEMSLLSGAPASATVAALTDCEVWLLQQADFLELLAYCPVLARHVGVILSQRLVRATDHVPRAIARLMRLRVSPAAPPGLAEAIARSVAEHLASPLLVFDSRPQMGWQASEQLPELELALQHGRIVEHVRNSVAPCVLATPVAGATVETWARAADWLPGNLTHAIHIMGADQPLPSSLELAGQVKVDLTLWPESVRELPRDTGDVALLTKGEHGNSRRALERATRAWKARVVHLIAMEGEEAAGHIGWLARHLAGLKVGLALGSGGAAGFAHLGLLRGLQQANVPIDYLAGSSIGSIVAAAFSMGLPIDKMARTMAQASSQAVTLTVPRHSILSNRGMTQGLRRIFGELEIEDLPLPTAIVAVDVLECREVVLQHGPIWRATMASSSIPGVYPPVWIDNHCLVDGAVLDPVPAGILRRLGADVTLAAVLDRMPKRPLVSTGDPEYAGSIGAAADGRTPNLLSLLQRSSHIMAYGITERVVEGADLRIRVEIDAPVELRDFGKAGWLIPVGEAALRREWPRLVTLLPWLGKAKE